MENHRSDPYVKGFAAFDDEDDDSSSNNKQQNWASSPSSTVEMLGDDNHQQQQQQRGRRSGGGSSSSTRRFTVVPFAKKIDWLSLWQRCKEWIRNPLNMALFIWVVAVGVSGAILFMVMTGMLNRVLPEKPQRDTWFEVNNQILNALFTLMCLYQHPRRFYHLALLCRWGAADKLQLRQELCKDGACKPNERRHMAVVVLLLHLNCFAQYALCGLNLGYPRSKRPAVGVGVTISVAICAPAVAGLYNNLSPLGRDYEADPQQQQEKEDDDDQQQQRNRLQRKKRLEQEEEKLRCLSDGWVGGLFDAFWDDLSLAYLTIFCSCCVFGWNASRLGFGNMYVHVVTFVLFCLAPFFIFNVAAINIDDEAVRYALGMAGGVLCVLGLLYGGFWRIQMRRRFGLPENHACCGKPNLTDYLGWMCCYSCSLAQEVRTADAALEVVVAVQEHNKSSSVITHQAQRQQQQQHRSTTLGDELAIRQQPLEVDANDAEATVPPSVSVIIHKH